MASLHSKDDQQPESKLQMEETTQTTTTTTAMPEKSGSNASDSSRSSADAMEKEKSSDTEEETQASDGTINGRTKLQITLIMIALCLAVFLAALDVTIITTALPTISDALGSADGYTWIGSSFLLANAGAIPIFGKVSDVFGRKIMLLLSNVIFMVGSLVAGLANSIGMLIAARALQGIGAGGLTVLVNIVIGDIFPLRMRGKFYGIVGGVWAIAATTGPIIGGALTENVSWRWCFYLNLPVDGVAFFIILFLLNVHIPQTPLWEGLAAIDWIGALACLGGTLMFLFGLQYGGVSAPWDSAKVLCLIIFGVLSWILFGVWESRWAKYPILPLEIFNSMTNNATLIAKFLHSFVFIAASYYLPLYFQTVKGLSPILSGVVFLPMAFSVAVGTTGAGIFMGRTGGFLLPIYACFVMMGLGFGLFIDFDAHSGWAKIIVFQLIAGFGVGLAYQAPYIALQAHIKPRDLAPATATLGFVNTLATAVSVVVGQVVYLNQYQMKTARLEAELTPEQAARVTGGGATINTEYIKNLPQPAKNEVRVAFADSLQVMWIMYCAFAASGILVTIFIKPKKLTDKHEETVTGLEAEKANAEARAADREERKEARKHKHDKKHDLEAGPEYSTSG